MYKKRIQSRRSIKKIIAFIIFLCLMAGAAYFLFFSPSLWIEELSISTIENVPESEVRAIVQRHLESKKFWLIPQKSIFLAPLERIRADILDISSEIKSVIADKKLPNSLEIEIVRHQSIGIWCSYQKIERTATTSQGVLDGEEVFEVEKITKKKIGQCFNLDDEGVIYKESPLVSSSLILNIFDSRNQSAKIKDKVVSGEMIDFIKKIKKNLTDDFNIKVDDFEIISGSDLIAKTSQGWLVYFNSSYSLESQLNSLKAVLEELVKGARHSLEYIDLRIEGRAYYK